MCTLLQRDGFPGTSLITVASSTDDPLNTNVVVATPAVRAQLKNLASVYAPARLAKFGRGPVEIDIRAVEPEGTAGYKSALSADLTERKRASAELLTAPGIQLAPAARADLAAGRVDARVLLLLPALAHAYPMHILSFGAPAPGADPGIPLCSAVVAGSAHPPGLTERAYVHWLKNYMATQRGPYSGQAVIGTLHGQTVVTFSYGEPSALGLLNGF